MSNNKKEITLEASLMFEVESVNEENGTIDAKIYGMTYGLLGSLEAPTNKDSQIITEIFLRGLISNIHYCHDSKFRDSAEHLRYIISELEKGFISLPDISVITK